MRKLIYTVVFVLLLSVVVYVSYFLHNPCYSSAKKQTDLSVLHHNDDTIRIAYIGDSWAYYHTDKKCVIDFMIYAQIGKPVLLRNAGVRGLLSKEIYNGIFTDRDFRSVIEWGPDFCFVSAGINDSNRKTGSNNYKENMRLLISLLLDNQITPVILEIPYYDIDYIFGKKSLASKSKCILSMLWTQSTINCIDSYSNAYNDLINDQHWQDVVITIRRSFWNPNGYEGQKELYTTDRIHLNQDGYFVLDSCIASQIIEFLKQ